MFIDSPSFVKRKNIYSINSQTPSSSLAENQHQNASKYQYGKERNLILNYVRNSLNSHSKDTEALQRFRRQAQDRKRRRYNQKRHTNSLGLKLKLDLQACNDKQQLLNTDQPLLKSNSNRILSKHTSNVINPEALGKINQVQEYKAILRLKDKELKKKDKKLKNIILEMNKMGEKIKLFESLHGVIESEVGKCAKTYSKRDELNSEYIVQQKRLPQLNKQCTDKSLKINRNIERSLQKIKEKALKIRQISSRSKASHSNPSIEYSNGSLLDKSLTPISQCRSNSNNYLDNMNKSIAQQRQERSRISYFFAG